MEKGSKQSPEAKEKIRLSMMANKNAEGSKRTEEEKKNISDFMIGNQHRKGYQYNEEEIKQRSEENHWRFEGSYYWFHRQAWKLFGVKFCEICGITNEEYKKSNPRGCRLSMHCRTNMWWILEELNWITTCEYGCHQHLDHLDRR